MSPPLLACGRLPLSAIFPGDYLGLPGVNALLGDKGAVVVIDVIEWSPYLFIFSLVSLVTACIPATAESIGRPPAAINPTPVGEGRATPPETPAGRSSPTTAVTIFAREGADEAAPAPTLPSATPTLTPSPTVTAGDGRYHLPIAGRMYVDWIISNYVDNDPQAYHLIDYNQGSMTYDGHTGVDFLLRDLAQMRAGVSVLAARAGVVIDVFAQANDQAWISEETNFVVIEHEDGSRAIYDHLRRHSVQVGVGDRVQPGQPIAQVGVAGNAAHAHLHFEVRGANGRVIDIFREGLTAFDYPYPSGPHIFQAGVTHRADPHLYEDMFRYTPDHTTTLSTNDSPAFWYKVINVHPQDRLRTILISPEGSSRELFTMKVKQSKSVAYWYVFSDPLPPGWYAIRYFFQGEPAQSLSFRVIAP